MTQQFPLSKQSLVSLLVEGNQHLDNFCPLDFGLEYDKRHCVEVDACKECWGEALLWAVVPMVEKAG